MFFKDFQLQVQSRSILLYRFSLLYTKLFERNNRRKQPSTNAMINVSLEHFLGFSFLNLKEGPERRKRLLLGELSWRISPSSVNRFGHEGLLKVSNFSFWKGHEKILKPITEKQKESTKLISQSWISGWIKDDWKSIPLPKAKLASPIP